VTKAILFSQMTPTGDPAAFHHWYNSEHVPARIVLPGFLRARRFAPLDDSKGFLAIYETSGREAFASEGYAALRADPTPLTRRVLATVEGFTRYLAEEISDTGPAGEEGPVLSVNAFRVPADREAAFEDWYETEHVPALMQASGWLRVRRYRVYEGSEEGWTHLALHELRSAAAMDAPERARARAAPKRQALAAEPWYSPNGRWLYETILDTAAR
jgi:hypothetical protein